jgi:hypothetical protein
MGTSARGTGAERVNRVFNPDLRPLVSEAYRCYASGSARGAIVLTWTAACADLIAKAQSLHEEGESHAKDLGVLIMSVVNAGRA